VLDKIRRRFPWLELIWADGGYNAWQVDAAAVRRRGIRLSDRGPFPNGCISSIPIGPFGSRDDGSNPSPWVSRAEAHYGIWACRAVRIRGVGT
jgi:hypothetical protein